MSRSRKRKVLPGFRLTLGFTLLYLSLIVLIPLATTFAKLGGLTWPQFWHAIASPVTLAAYRLSFGASFFAALVNSVFGLLVAWVLVRYQFWGKKLMDALVDLPFALPTAVAGITLATLYAPNGWIGRWLTPLGIKVSYTSLGVFVALTFIGLPFVVRTVQPVLEDFDLEIEEAAASLGANRFKTFFRVILPMIYPALLTGFALAFARALAELFLPAFRADIGAAEVLLFVKQERVIMLFVHESLAAGFAGVPARLYVPFVHLPESVLRLLSLRTRRVQLQSISENVSLSAFPTHCFLL